MWYEYRCPDGHVTEKKGGVDDVHAPCSACNRQARRREFNLPVIVGEMREQKYRVSEFLEASQEVDYLFTRAENEGVAVKRPNLYKAGLREARRRGAKLANV